MLKNNKLKIKKSLVNFIGGAGYLFCALQWVVIVLIYFNFVQAFVNYIAPSNSEQIEKTQAIQTYGSSEPGIIMIIFGILVIVGVLLLTIYLIYKIPYTVANTSQKVVKNTANYIAPVIIKAQHKKDVKKAKFSVTYNLIIFIKFLIVILPILLTFLYQFVVDKTLSYQIAISASILLATISGLMFAIQHLIALLIGVNKKYLW